MKKLITKERGAIEKAATLIANTISEGKIFHVFGTGGHSNIASIEMCHRAGNLVPSNAILDPGLSCEHGATRWIEKVTGYAKQVLRYYRVKKGDIIILLNAYGINAVTIDTALECKEIGATTIAITSPELSTSIPPNHPNRHPSKKNLCDIADLVINSYTPYGEAVVEIKGYDFKVSPSSTIINIFILNSINAKACEILASRGVEPPVWISGNIPGGDEANQENMDRYFGTLRHI